MTKTEAEAIGAAIEEIEVGRVNLGVAMLRHALIAARHTPPPLRIVESREPRQGGKQS